MFQQIIEDWTADAHHEELGSRWLAQRFRPEVSEPVRLHVQRSAICARTILSISNVKHCIGPYPEAAGRLAGSA